MESVIQGAAAHAGEAGGSRVSIVIPARNEAANLPHLLPRLPGWVHEVILVNDHSTDETVEVARRLLPGIRIVQTGQASGKGAALQVGFAAARGDMIVMMDADGSSDPEEVPRFVEALLAGAYLAKGSRFAGGGGSADITPLRRLGSRLLIWVANRLFGARFTDMFCGLNAFWKDCLAYFEVDCNGFEIETLLHLRICKANLAMVEVPSFEHARLHGVSHFRTFRDGWRVFKMILREAFNGRSVIRPVKMRPPALSAELAWDDLAVAEHIAATQ